MTTPMSCLLACVPGPAHQLRRHYLLDAGRIDTGTLSVSPEHSGVSALVERARNTFLSGGGRHGAG